MYIFCLNIYFQPTLKFGESKQESKLIEFEAVIPNSKLIVGCGKLPESLNKEQAEKKYAKKPRDMTPFFFHGWKPRPGMKDKELPLDGMNYVQGQFPSVSLYYFSFKF